MPQRVDGFGVPLAPPGAQQRSLCRTLQLLSGALACRGGTQLSVGGVSAFLGRVIVGPGVGQEVLASASLALASRRKCLMWASSRMMPQIRAEVRSARPGSVPVPRQDLTYGAGERSAGSCSANSAVPE